MTGGRVAGSELRVQGAVVRVQDETSSPSPGGRGLGGGGCAVIPEAIADKAFPAWHILCRCKVKKRDVTGGYYE